MNPCKDCEFLGDCYNGECYYCHSNCGVDIPGSYKGGSIVVISGENRFTWYGQDLFLILLRGWCPLDYSEARWQALEAAFLQGKLKMVSNLRDQGMVE